MRRKGLTYKTISEKIGISQERARQVCTEVDLNAFYKKLESDYESKISEADHSWIRNEVTVLRKQNRNKKLVIRRSILVKYMHDTLAMSFYQIAKVMKRNHTSITNLYYK